EKRAERAAPEDIARIVSRDRLSPIQPDVNGFHREANRYGFLDATVCNLFAIDKDPHCATLADAASVIIEVEAKFTLALWQLVLCFHVVGVAHPASQTRRFAPLEKEPLPGRPAAIGQDYSISLAFG